MSGVESISLFTEARKEAREWFQGEIATLRTGRVKPDIVERIPVEHYGTRTPLNGLASVTNSDARTLVVSAWDASAIHAIEKALTEANLGIQPSVDGEIIRLVFPSLTEEIREATVRKVSQKAEEARVKLRQARDESIKLMKEAKEAGNITEDDFYEGKKELDELIDKANEEIEQLAAKKEEDIQRI